MFSRLDDGRWEVTPLPFMKTRILTDDEKQDRHSYSRVAMRSVLLMYSGLLITTALKPLILWLGISIVLLYDFDFAAIIFAILAATPMIVFFVIGMSPLLRAQKNLKHKKLLKTAPRGQRVKWAPYWRIVGTALGPLPIQIVFALTVICLFGTILFSQMIGDIYLTDIGIMAIFCLLLGPAIPAGLRSRNGGRASVAAKEE